MIVIKNTQRKIKVDLGALQSDTRTILNLIGYADFDVGIWLTTNKTIRFYNRNYRNKDKSTDILSFSAHPELRPGQRLIITDDDEKNLGDLIIAPEYVVVEAHKLGVTFDQHLRRLLVHGICHLIGYDHEEDADYKIMLQKEMYLLKKLQK